MGALGMSDAATDSIRKSEGRWFRLDNSSIGIIRELGPTAFGVYAYLSMRSDHQGECFPSYARAAEDLGASEATIKRAIRALSESGVVKVIKATGIVNQYRLPALSETDRTQVTSDQGSIPPPRSPVTRDPGHPCAGTQVTSDLLTRPKNKTQEQDPPFSDFENLNTDQFRASWQDWIDHRKDLKLPSYKALGIKKLFGRLNGMGGARAIAAIEYSIGQNWKGIYEERSNGQTNGHAKPATQYKTLTPPAPRARSNQG